MLVDRAIGSTSVGQTLQDARLRLGRAAFEPSTREATLLLSHVLDLDEASLLAHPERRLEPRQRGRFETLMRRRLEGEPVAYLLGEREFYGRAFSVDSRVLIPRPETEHLVETALSLPLTESPRVLDLGTGSGVIALTLALELPSSRVVATDRSIDAIAVAATNRRRWRLESRVDLLATDLARGLELSGIDLVVSNPPYIKPQEEAGLSPEITRYEPPLALYAPPDGLSIVRRILDELAGIPQACPLLLEIGAGQQEALTAAAAGSPFALQAFCNDYAGIPRVAMLRRR